MGTGIYRLDLTGEREDFHKCLGPTSLNLELMSVGRRG